MPPEEERKIWRGAWRVCKLTLNFYLCNIGHLLRFVIQIGTGFSLLKWIAICRTLKNFEIIISDITKLKLF